MAASPGRIVLDFGADAERFRAAAVASAVRLGVDDAESMVARSFLGGDSRYYVIPPRHWGNLRVIAIDGLPVHGAQLSLETLSARALSLRDGRSC